MGRPIDKVACMSWIYPKKTDIDINNGLLRAAQVKYIVRTEIRIVGHRKLLILYLYDRTMAAKGDMTPTFAVFQASDDFVTFDHRLDEKTLWKTSALKRMKPRGDFTEDCAFYSREDELTVFRFFHKTDLSQSGFSLLNEKQEKISAARTLARRKKQERKILERFRTVKPIGKRFKAWAVREALPHYVFYRYEKGAKPIKGLCSSCQHEVEVNEARHNKNGVCPHCGVPVTYKSLGKAGRIWDEGTAQMIQRVSDQEILIRIIKVRRFYYGGKASHYIYESMRIFLAWNRWGRVMKEQYYNLFRKTLLTEWKMGPRPGHFGYKETFDCIKAGHLFTENLPDALAGSPWQYCQIDKYYLSDHRPLEVEPYLDKYLKKPFLEYLVKLGLFRLAGDIVFKRDSYGYRYTQQKASVNENGKNLKEILGVDMSDVPLLQRINAGHIQLGFLQELRRMRLRPDQEFLAWCGRSNVTKLNDVLTPLRYMTAYKLLRYVQEQFEEHPGKYVNWTRQGYYQPSETLSAYRDYLCMCEGLGYDMTSSFVLFPRDLPAAHDKVMNLSDPEKAKAYDRQIATMYPEFRKRYCFEDDGFMIVAPKTAMEIEEEGNALHHCVGSYVSRVALHESIILFLREKDRPSTPYCTLEVVNGELTQYRCQNNLEPPPKVMKFLDVWKDRVLNNQDEREYFPNAA